MVSHQQALEELLEQGKQPVPDSYGLSIANEQAIKKAEHDKWLKRTVMDQVNERVAQLQDQLNHACELRALIVNLGIGDLKVETMRQLLF